MPKIAIIHYREVEFDGYDCYLVQDFIPISATDWYDVTVEELSALRKYYKPPPRKGYKLSFAILELADEQEISTQIKNCVQLALKAKQQEELAAATREREKTLREQKKKAKKEAEEKRLLAELQLKYKDN